MTNSVNLLPISFRRRQAAKQILMFWTMAGFLVVVTILMVWLGRHESDLSRRIAMLETESGPIKAMKQRTVSVRKELVKLRADSDLLSRLLPADDALQTIGAIGAACGTTNNGVRVRSLELSLETKSRLNNRPADTKPGKKNALSESSRLVLHLQADDDTLAARLVSHLKENPRFRTVELKSAGGLRDGRSRMIELHSEILTAGNSRSVGSPTNPQSPAKKHPSGNVEGAVHVSSR